MPVRASGCRTPDRGLERAPGQADADAILADDRRRDDGGLLVSVGPLSGLSHHERDRPAQARSSSRRGRVEPDSGVILSIMPA
jgi:hypothetical protein